MPAGHGLGQMGQPRAPPISMMDEEDEEMILARQMATKGRVGGRGVNRSTSGSRLGDMWKAVKAKVKGGPKVYEGEREIQLNDAGSNDKMKFCGNYVSTSKYNVVTFVPKFFTGKFSSSLFLPPLKK